jgi:HPt (histidine-containing phosphotransfer) domain-containing protein
MAIGFFDGQKADASPESIKRKRAMIAQLLSGGRAPRDVGEGLHAIGRGLQAAVLGSRADAAEQASNASSAEAMRGIYSGFGSPMASAGNPVATGSGATRVVAAPEQFAQLFAENEAKHSLPQGYLARAAQIESNFNPSAKNPNSSAGGIFQFIDSTARQYGLRNRFDPVEATAAAARLAADNRDFLARRLGREPSAGELYLAHQQGAGGAAKLLANPDALASSVVGNAAARLNRGAGMTAGAFANQWINKFGTPVVRPGPGATPMPLQTASAGPQSNDAQMQDGAGELQAGGSGLMAEPAVYRGQLNDVPSGDLMQRGPMPALPPGFDLSSLVMPAGQPSGAMGQGIADNEEQTRIMEAQMAAEQGLPYAGNEPGQFNSMFSPDLMGGGLNPFVPRDMVQPEDAIAQAPVPMPPQMDRATFDQVTAGLPQRAPAFAGQGLAPSWAGDPDKLAPGAEQASFVIPARDTVALPAANNRPPQSPFVPPAMRAPLPVDMGGENSGGSAMQFIESEFARREGRPDPRTAMGAPQGYNPFVQQPTQAPQMPAGGGSVQGVSQGDTMAGGAAQAPAQASNRIAELASIAGNPMVRPEVRQLAMAEIQTERARAQAEADRVRTQAQNNDTADALKIDRRLGGVAPAVAAAAKANFDRKFGQAKRSLQPVYGTDAQGNTVVLQLGDDGTVVQPQLPKDVKIATGVDKVDTGTEFVFMDKRTGAVVGRQPKDVAGAERAKVIGKDQGEGVTNAPAALATADQTLAAIDGVLNDKNLGWATGAPGIVTRNVPGTPTFGTGQRIEQLQGRAFLQAFESLKGGGAITEIEGQKATQAIARLNARQSEKDFREALKELRDIVATGRARAAAKAEQGGGQPSPQAGQASAALQNARKAIADGAPRQAVIDRLRQAGIDPGGL